jgi:hypothetical protein
MAELKPGTRLKSAVCATQVMVIAAPAAGANVTCGAAEMVAMDQDVTEGATPDPSAAQGTALGKRYVNEAGDLELLCTKPGAGSLAVDGALLVLKEAKALPSSD